MAQGLQAWNENGVLVVDIGDYSTRFYTSLWVTLPAYQDAVSVGVGGVTNNSHFAVITQGSDASIDPLFLATSLTATAGNGVVWVTAINGALTISRTVLVDVYAFI